MDLYQWTEIAKEQMNPLLERQVIHTNNLTVARIHLKKGAAVPEHSHHNEQVTMLEAGRLRFLISGQQTILEAGQILRIPPNAPHRVEALEDSLATDLFSPPREDWAKGDDSYLR
jgi:quercetin dioxygenase-like cupin family protein